jgi:SAM-dependent methyltransferase
MDDVWTQYWQSGNPDSCIPTKSPDDIRPIRAFWRELAVQLNAGSRVLDLATGNGAVPRMLLEANQDLQITAVDKAAIDPVKYLADLGRMADVKFSPGVDIEHMHYDDASFDAVTSQFGIEYVALERAVSEVARVIRSDGEIRLLMHHCDSEVLVASRAKRTEMEPLLANGGVLDKLKAYVQGTLDANALEAAGQAHVDAAVGRSPSITGQIFEGVNRAINAVHKDDRSQAAAICSTMTERLGAERDRLKLLEAAAMTPVRFQQAVTMLENQKVDTVVAEPLQAGPGENDNFIIGWQYRGKRR